MTVPQAEILFFGDFIPGHRFINTRGVLDYYGYFYSGGGEKYRDSTYADFLSETNNPTLAAHHGLSAVTELDSSILPQLGIIYNSYAISLKVNFNQTLAQIADISQVNSMFLYSFQYEISKLSINYQIGVRLVASVLGSSDIEFVAVNRALSSPTTDTLFTSAVPIGNP